MKKIGPFLLVFLLSALCFFEVSGGGVIEKKVLDPSVTPFKSENYSTSVGLRGGFSSGLTIKHFIKDNVALEGIIGIGRDRLSLSGIYEIHKYNALSVSNLAWEYGLGGRMIIQDSNKKNDDDHFMKNSAIGVIGILGLEYKLDEIPFTIGVDILPVFDFVGRYNGFIDGSFVIRYVIK